MTHKYDTQVLLQKCVRQVYGISVLCKYYHCTCTLHKFDEQVCHASMSNLYVLLVPSAEFMNYKVKFITRSGEVITRSGEVITRCSTIPLSGFMHKYVLNLTTIMLK